MKPENKSLLKSFEHAFNGMNHFFKHDHNGRLEICIAIIPIVFALWLGISTVEWIAIIFCIALVIGFEMMNNALEKLCDIVQEDYHPIIKLVKDMAAAAVMWCAISAVLVSVLIFLHKIFALS